MKKDSASARPREADVSRCRCAGGRLPFVGFAVGEFMHALMRQPEHASGVAPLIFSRPPRAAPRMGTLRGTVDAETENGPRIEAGFTRLFCSVPKSVPT